MNYGDEPIVEFARRTKYNLEFIQNEVNLQKSRGEKPSLYEVTQLVNSLLGLIVHPKESLPASLFKITLDTLYKQEWPEFKLTDDIQKINTITIPQTLLGLLRLMRNSIAHNNIQYPINEKNKTISKIIFWNENRGNKNWEIEVDIIDLETFVNKLLDRILSHSNQNPNDRNHNGNKS